VLDFIAGGHCCVTNGKPAFAHWTGEDRAQLGQTRSARFIAPRPFLILAGKLDGEFPCEGVVDVFKKARKFFGKGKSSEHVNLRSFDVGHELSGDMMLEASRWFDRWLKP